MAYHAEALSRAGYGVLLFDLRGHGDSGGRRFSRGVLGVDDVLAAVAWLSRRHDVRGRIGLLGVSVGGMLAIQAAARNAYIRAVAADGPILGAIQDLPPPQGWLDRLWRYPQERYYQKAIDWFSRDKRPPANVVALGRIARRPILFISTGQGLEQRLTRHFYDAAVEPKRLWEIPRAAHAAGWHVEPEAYGREMIDFFDDALSVEERPDDALTEPYAAAPAEPTADPAPPVERAPEPIDERTVAPPVAMMVAFASIPVAILGLFIPFQLRWGVTPPRLPAGRPLLALAGLFALFMAGLLLREVVHWAAYRWIGRVPRGATRLATGHMAIGPRVRCETPVPARVYRLILTLPVVLLGVVPGIIGIVVGSWLLVLWALWLVVASSGDFVALWAMRGLPPDTPVRAHPRRPGCEILASRDS